jgi:DNA-binding transcriptional ArsR family regulator
MRKTHSKARNRRAREQAKTEERLAVLGQALSHPVRIRILVALADDGEHSPKELAERLDEPLGNVSYHVRSLAGSGAVELRRTVPRRGAVQHYYSLARPFRGVIPAVTRLLPQPD